MVKWALPRPLFGDTVSVTGTREKETYLIWADGSHLFICVEHFVEVSLYLYLIKLPIKKIFPKLQKDTFCTLSQTIIRREKFPSQQDLEREWLAIIFSGGLSRSPP